MTERQPTKGDALTDQPSAHCGVGALVDLNGRRSHQLVQDALSILERLDHRGARGAEENTGDGAGILVQKPDVFFRRFFDLPAEEAYGVGQLFLPKQAESRKRIQKRVGEVIQAAGFQVLGWRGVPTSGSNLGATAKVAEPEVLQVLVSHGNSHMGD